MSIVQLEDAKRQLNIELDDTSYDEEIQMYCDGITATVEDYLHEIIEQRTITEDIENCTRGGRRFRLWSVPIISITSLTSVTSGFTWDVANLRVDRNSGLVRVLAGPPVRGLAEAVIEAGYETVPEHYRRGALVVLQHNWETRRGVGAMRSSVVGAEEIHDPRHTYAIPRKALEWLGSPRVMVG